MQYGYMGRVTDNKSGSRPHTLPPEELYLAHLSPQLQPIQSELESRLRATQSRNEELVDSIRRRREEVDALVVGLEAVVRDLEGANEVLGGVVQEHGVRAEVIDVLKDLREVGAKL